MSLTNEYTDNILMDESSILDAHLRLLFRAFHYETPCNHSNRLRVEFYLDVCLFLYYMLSHDIGIVFYLIVVEDGRSRYKTIKG